MTDDTVAGFAAGLRRFLSLSEPSRAAMRTRAAGCFRRRFDAAAAAAQLLVVLEAVVRRS